MLKLKCEASEHEKHDEDVMAISYFDDHIYTGDYQGLVKMWTMDLKLVKEWQAHMSTVYSITASDKSLFSSSSDGEIKEWDPKNCTLGCIGRTQLLSPVTEQPTEVKTLAVHGNQLYAGDDQGNLIRYGPNFEPNWKKLVYNDIWSMALSKDGKTVFTVRDNDVLVCDTDDELKKEEYQATMMVQCSIQGRAPVVVGDNYICCGDRKGLNVAVHESAKPYNKVGNLVGGHDMIINSIDLYKDICCSSGWDGRVILWDLKNECKQLSSVELGTYVNTLKWTSDGTTIICGGKGGRLTALAVE